VSKLTRYQTKKPARLRLVGFVTLSGHISNRWLPDLDSLVTILTA
jgi:hypothetical protein